jgi:hypothetical protein
MSGDSRFFAQFGGGGGGGGGISELEVGVTPIVGGTVGRLLFEGTGNVLQESNGLFWDITNSRLGVRTLVPECTLDVVSTGTSNTRGIQGSHYDNTTAFSPSKIIGRRARGTEAAPLAVLSGDALASFNGRGRKTTAWSDTVGGYYVSANENWTDAATGTFLSFRGVTDGTTTVSEWMRVSQGNVSIGTTTTSGVRLRVRTDNNVSTNTALYVENSDNMGLLQVFNDGKVNFQTWGTTSSNTQKNIRLGSGLGQQLNVLTDGTITLASGSNELVRFSPSASLPIGSSANISSLVLAGAINVGTGATGIVRGLYVQAMSSYTNYRAIETENNSGYSFYGAGTAPMYVGGRIGVNITNPSSLLNIKGADTSASTTSLYVQDSADAAVLSVRNNSSLDFINWGDSTVNSVKRIGLNNTSVGTQLQVESFGTANNTTGLATINVGIVSSFSPDSGISRYTNLSITPTINQTGTATGITRGVYVDPILTAASSFRAIETSNNSGYSFYGAGTAPMYINGRIGVGRTTAGASVDIQAAGALSTDVAFRVRNSADTADILAIQGNSQIVKGATSVIVPNTQAVISAATVTPVSGNDIVTITAQAEALTLANPTGTWSEGQDFFIRIKDNGTARAITYGSNYRAIGVTLPPSTTASKTTYLGLVYNSTDTKWDVIGVSTEA